MSSLPTPSELTIRHNKHVETITMPEINSMWQNLKNWINQKEGQTYCHLAKNEYMHALTNKYALVECTKYNDASIEQVIKRVNAKKR